MSRKPSADPLPALAAPLPPALRTLAEMGTLRRYRKGTLIIQEGEQGDTVYLVLQGRLRAFVSDARGREVTLAHHGPGEYVGEMSLDGGPRSASVEAVEPTLCAVVTLDTLRRHIATYPEFAMALVERLIKRARIATASARSMALLDVYGRLKRYLEERGQPQPDGSRVIAVRPTHQAIASEIGCSREMVSRLMKDLEQGLYIEATRAHLRIARLLPSRW